MADVAGTPLVVAQETTGGETGEDAAAAGDTHADEASAVGETHATTEHEAGAVGMPQLDIDTFGPQLAWLAFSFILLLILMWAVALPRVARIMAARERKVADDLSRAEQVKQESDAVVAAYDRAIAEARAKAQEAMRATAAEAAAIGAERETASAGSIKQRLDEAQRSIEASKATAIGELKSVATEVAAAAAAKLAGVTLPREQVVAAVDQAMARRHAGAKE
jgi:F-type H+-transporting ATPase subunit b